MDIDSGTDKWDIIPFDIMRFKEIVSTWQNSVGWNSLYWNNHDQPRVVSRFGNCETEEYRIRSAKMLAAALYLQKGTPFIFQGEEIGMTNVPFSDVSELRDIESINYYCVAEKRGNEAAAWQSILIKGRDNARTPMQWNNMPNGGFSNAEPWIRVNPNYTYINVQEAMSDDRSILHFYRQLIALRSSSKALIYGRYCELMRDDKQVFAYSRTMDHEKWVVLCNMSKEIAHISIMDELSGTNTVLSNIETDHEPEVLLPYETRIICTLNR
jgi:glycosidase